MDDNKDLEIQVADQINVTGLGPIKRESTLKIFMKITILLVGIIASISTIMTFILQIGPKKLEVTAQVLSNDELTLRAPEAELNARFSYAGEDVSHLWKIRVRFINSGRKTIIGVGNQKNIIGDMGLNLGFFDGAKILKIQKEEDNIDATVIKTDADRFQIQFVQWRPSEYVFSCFYVASEKELHKNPLPTPIGREIIDGDLKIEDTSKERRVTKKRIIDYFPSFLSFFGLIVGLVVIAIAITIAVYGTYVEWSRYLSIKKWKRKYSDKFADYLNNMKVPPSEENKKIFLKEPWKLSAQYWQGFEDGGKKCPSPSIIENAKTGIFFTVIMMLVLLGSFSIISTFLYL